MSFVRIAKVMQAAKNIQTLAVRQSSSKAKPVAYSPLNPKLKAQQELFQAPNDLPVFLKGGTSDMILYRLSMALMLFGVGWSMSVYYKAANPPR